MCQEHIRTDFEIAHGRAAVTGEDIYIVLLADFKFAASAFKGIKIYIARSIQVDTAQINGEFVVDERPNVIATAKS